MKARLTRIVAVAAIAAGVAMQLGVARTASGCGLDWTLPRNHFEGVTNQGNVSYWEKIGAVDCGDGLVLPLHINFNSHRDGGTPSPYLGQGWMLPLLESKFIEESEDRFVMIQPDGLNNLFLRAGPNSSVLNGSAGWKGEIKDDTITVYADCGWKLTFNKGHIASMTTAKGRRFDWMYENGRVSELREGNATRLKVEYGADGRVQGLDLLEGKRIFIVQDKKPRVQAVGGQNIIAGLEDSLSRLVLADGRQQNFTFGTNDKMQPTLSIGSVGIGADEDTAAKRQIIWDPQTKLAVRDGEWTYQVARNPRSVASNAAITRTNEQGQKEYWFYDGANGQETTQRISGMTTVRKFFVSGSLAGRTRSINDVSPDGVSTTEYSASYDEKGNLIKEVRNGTTTRYVYHEAPSGRRTETFVDGKLTAFKQFDLNNQLVEDQSIGVRNIRVQYSDNGTKVETIKISAGSLIERRFDNTGRLVGFTINGDDAPLIRTINNTTTK